MTGVRRSRMLDAEALLAKCPACAAPVDQACKDGGLDVAPHDERVAKAARQRTWGVLGCERKHVDDRPMYAEASTARIALVACCGPKAATPAKARDLYRSPLFRASVAYVERALAVPWLILSARHGLVHPDQVIAPYDQTIARMRKGERDAWGERVADSIHSLACWSAPRVRELDVLAGREYVELVIGQLARRVPVAYRVSEPLAGMMIGERLAFLKKQIAEGAR